MTENVNQILKKLKSHFHFRGIILSDCFEDFDKTNSGLVTESQVRISSLFCALLFSISDTLGAFLLLDRPCLILMVNGCHMSEHNWGTDSPPVAYPIIVYMIY